VAWALRGPPTGADAAPGTHASGVSGAGRWHGRVRQGRGAGPAHQRRGRRWPPALVCRTSAVQPAAAQPACCQLRGAAALTERQRRLTQAQYLLLFTLVVSSGGFLFGYGLHPLCRPSQHSAPGAVLTRSSPSGRYDTGVIAGALPYLRDTLLKDYESDAARCAPARAPLAAPRSAACAALLAGAGHPLKTLSPGRRRRAGPSADRPASAHAASVPPPPAPGPTSPAGWAQQQAPAPPALDRSRTSR